MRALPLGRDLEYLPHFPFVNSCNFLGFADTSSCRSGTSGVYPERAGLCNRSLRRQDRTAGQT